MKPFQMILFFVVVILVAGVAALYWGKSIEEAMVPVVIAEPVPEPVEEELPSGSYLVLQVDERYFFRLAVNDIGSSNPLEFATVDQPMSVSGGLTTDVYGQDLLMHRYLDDDQDGILSLEGKIIETRPEQWGTIRSTNGRYQVDFEIDRGDGRVAITSLTVTDIDAGTTLLKKTMNPEELDGGWDLEPFVIDDLGDFIYIHEVCGCEATLSGLWQLEIATGELTRLDTLVDLDSWHLSSLDPQKRRLLAVSTNSEPSNVGPYNELVPPTTIRILDLNTLESIDLLLDEKQAWDRAWLDPEGNDRYVVSLWGEGNKLYIVDFTDSEITEESYLAGGRMRDWVGDWLVVQDSQDSTLRLVNVESKEEVMLDLPGERVQYIGSIERE